MKCPKDNKQLKLIEKNSITGHHCASCFGVFLPGRYVKAFKHNYQTNVLQKLKPSYPQPAVLSPCPACNNDLILSTIDKTAVDQCRNCDGIWFDADVVQNIINKYGTKPNSAGMTGLDAILSLLPFPFGGGGSC